MRKIFTFLFAALMSVSMFANLVTIGSYELTEGYDQSIVKDDITLEYIYPNEGELSGYLKCPSGFKITQVEVTGSYLYYLNIGWNEANPWQGSSESVYIECQFGGDITIYCTYAEAAPNKPTISGEDMFSESTTVTIASSTAGATIYYTIDGSNPTEGEKLVYSDPFTLTESATVKAAAYKNGQYSTITTKNFIKLTPAPVGPNYVVWDTEFLSNIYCGLKMSTPPVLVNENNVKDGITCVFSGTQPGNSLANNREFYLSAADSKLTFSHESRNITKIEIYGQGGYTCRDWTWDATNFKLVWEGTPAAAVDLQGPESGSLDVYQIYQMVFTLEESEPAGEVTVVFEANGNRKEVEVESLPHTFACDMENGELDGIIQELYALPFGGFCDYSTPTATGNAAVTAGRDGNYNQYITISEAFEGTATVTGIYIKYTDAEHEYAENMNYTLTISIKGDEPEPQGVGPREELNLGTDYPAGEHYQVLGEFSSTSWIGVGDINNETITVESLNGEIIDNITLEVYLPLHWTGYSIAATSGEVSGDVASYQDLVITNINATSVTLSRVGEGENGGSVLFSKIIVNDNIAPEPEPEPQPEPATTYNVTFTDINSNVKVVENITLPHTFSCDYTNGNGELDLIIQEFYNEPGGHCATNGWPWGGNDNEVVVGHDGNNHFVTINAPFIGTSFMSGYYDGINDGNFYYTFHITIAAAGGSTPEPEPAVEIGDLNNATEIETFLTTYDGQTIDELIIDRPVLNNMYNTLCLPFNMDAAQIAASSLNGVEIYELEEVTVANDELFLGLSDAVNAVVAGRPYIVKYSAASQLDDLDFENVTINNADLTAQAVTMNGVTFKGTFTPFVMGIQNGFDTNGGYLFLGQNNELYWPNTNNPLKPFRAYFYIDLNSGSSNAPLRFGMPARIGRPAQMPTGVESIQPSAVSSQKVMIDGQLIIIRNGVEYNVSGQIVK